MNDRERQRTSQSSHYIYEHGVRFRWLPLHGRAYHMLTTEQKGKYHVTMHEQGHCRRYVCWVCGPKDKNGRNMLDTNLGVGATEVIRVLLSLEEMDRNVMADRLAEHNEQE